MPTEEGQRASGPADSAVAESSTDLSGLVSGRSVIVCCGSGGTGKTTISAAIGLAGAEQGRRTCVVTIDPARRLADAVLRVFSDPDGGFVDHANVGEALGRVALVDRPLIENAHLAQSLLRLRATTDDERYAEAALRALERFAPTYRRVGSFAAPYAAAVRRALDAPVVVTVVGEPTATADFRRDARGLPDPFVVVRSFAPEDASRAATGFPADAPRAYVCVGTTCGAPVASAAALHDSFLPLYETQYSLR